MVATMMMLLLVQYDDLRFIIILLNFVIIMNH